MALLYMHPHLWSRLLLLSPKCPAVRYMMPCLIKSLICGTMCAGATGFTGSIGDTGITGASGYTGALELQVAPAPLPWPGGLFLRITS
jgi:hypothetical protein